MIRHQSQVAHHLAHEHHLSPFSTYLKEIVYGGNDGIITTFAVVAGFAGSQTGDMGALPVLAVLVFGFANLFADAVSMSLGNFLSTRSELEVYQKEKRRELREIRENRHFEELETLELLTAKGFTADQAKTLLSIYRTNEGYWVDFMMNQELKLPNPEGENPYLMAGVTLMSFVVFGLIPLLPYLLLGNMSGTFVYSCLATFGALLLLALFRWRITGNNPVRVVGETLLLGGIAAIIAYAVGTYIG